MKATPLPIEGLILVECPRHVDERGFFCERYQSRRFQDLGLPTDFVQDNHSRSLPGVLRGLHYQAMPRQGKLVGVIRGRVWDVAVDLRVGSPTFGSSFGVELSDENGKLLWIPAGFAHGYCVTGEEPADVFYKVDAPYSPQGEGGIYWQDRDLAIAWPVRSPKVSKALPFLGVGVGEIEAEA